MNEVPICKLYKRVAYASTGPKDALFTRLRCKQWSCPFCAARNAHAWREHLAEKLPAISNEWFLVTLTASSQTRSQKASLTNIRTNLDKFFKRVKRVFGAVEYVRTYEKHPTSSAIHTHMVISGLSPFVALGCSSKLQAMAIGVSRRDGRNGVWSLQTWVKKVAQELGMGYIANVKSIIGEIQKVVWYVTKYLTKSQQDFQEKGLRHVQVSRGVGSPKGEKVANWQTAAYITANMFAPNASILDVNLGVTIDNNYWELHGFYPFED